MGKQKINNIEKSRGVWNKKDKIFVKLQNEQQIKRTN